MKINFIIILLLFFVNIVYAQISVEYFGGADRVSGTNALVSVDDTSVIVDCGSFYDENNLSSDNSYIPPKILSATAMVLTHAHIDHSGRLPLLISEGFDGKIYCTPATKKIIFEIFDDGWNFEFVKQKYFCSLNKFKNVKKYHKGTVSVHWYNDCKQNMKNIYTFDKKYSISQLHKQHKINFKVCKKCLEKYLEEIEDRFVEINYHQQVSINNNIKFYLFDSAHIVGSSSIFFDVEDKQNKKTIVISGDLGSGYSNLLNSKELAPLADYIFIESTYGGISKNVSTDDYITFQKDIANELKNNKRVWIPALSLHRTQKVLYEIKEGQNNDIIPIDVPVFSLSPSSNGITKQYENELKNPSQQKWFSQNVYDGKTFLPQNYSTKKPKEFPKPSIIISASGMMDQGFSLSLVNKLLPLEDTTVFLVSYASPQTPAGKLKKNAKTIKTKYGLVNVKATTKIYNIFSDHPDIKELSNWLSNQNKNKTKIFLVHGDSDVLLKCKSFYIQQGYKKVEVVKQEKILIN